MKRLGLRVITIGLLLALGLATGACKSADREDTGREITVARPVDFAAPSTRQEADRVHPPGDRTPQALQAVGARGELVVAAGFDQSSNVSRPLFLSSDDGGSTWVRRELDEESVQRSGTIEYPTDIAAGPAGFVAIGTSNSRPVLWRSSDGHSWERSHLDEKVFTANDSVSAITAIPTGFAIVGQSNIAAGGNRFPIVYWQSSDGVSWQRAVGAELGLKPTANGELSLTAIVASGDNIVISGGLSTPGNAKQDERLQYWYSTDAGKSFRPSVVRGEIAADYRVFNAALAFGDGKFVALAQGGGYDEDGSWDGVVLEGGAAGSSWQVAAEPRVTGSTYDDEPKSLAKAGKDWVLSSQTTAGTVELMVAAGPGWSRLADRSDGASQRGRGDQIATDSVAVGNDVVVVGSNNRSGTTEPAAWRYHDRAVTRIALPAEASAGRASSSVTTVLAAGKDVIAVGSVADAPTAWQQLGGKWRATTLSGRSDGVNVSLTDATSTADGRVVAMGEKSLPIGSRAAVWIRDRNGRWAETDSPVFGVNANSPYGGPSPKAIAIGAGGWVVVGQRSDGDSHVDAWTMHSADGKAWTEGGGGRVLPAGPESDSRRTTSGSLRTVQGEAEMSTVLAVGSRFVAGGDPGDQSPAAWLSPNGSSWGAPIRLPLPKKVYSANVSALGRTGNTLVAIGDYYRTAADTEGGWTSWTSRNGGASWTAGPIVLSGPGYAHTLVNVPNGLVALGYEGSGDQLDAAAWFTRDGVSWKPVVVDGARLKGPGRQGFTSAIVRDGMLLMTAFDIPPSGGGYYTLTADLPG
ncbi:hypothetical protein [Kribbella sp. NPDC051620]|uniref:hypothetical protein n=1 Tax=Kribbella sp. NPDC051620 TaxID=3364120 RepID=UPI00379C557D